MGAAEKTLAKAAGDRRQDNLRRIAEIDAAVWREEMERRVRHYQALKREDDTLPDRLREENERVQDFDYWLSHYGWLVGPKKAGSKLIPFVPWPRQRELSVWYKERYDREEVGIVPKCRELGVTWWFLHRILHSWLYEESFSALVGSRNEKLVDKRGDLDALLPKVRWILAQQPSWIVGFRMVGSKMLPPEKWIRDNHLLIENLSNGARIVGESTNPSFGRGKRHSVVMIDEAADVKAPIMSSTWRALASVYRAAYLVYNPGPKGHLTYELHKGKSALDPSQIFEMDWTADPRRGPDFPETQIRPVGPLSVEEFQSQYGLKYGFFSREGLIYDAPRSEIAYSDEDRPEGLLERGILFGAWDFGSGPSLLCCLLALYDPEEDLVWVEHSLAWSQTQWQVASSDALAYAAAYPRRAAHFGDPAGRQRESDQQSWESNLRAGGVPILCLPSEANTSEAIEWGFKLIQQRFDAGKLRVHRQASYLWSCLEEWQRSVPDGMTLDYANREYLAPRADRFSHGGMALCYLGQALDVYAATRQRPRLTTAFRRTAKAPTEAALEAPAAARSTVRQTLRMSLQGGKWSAPRGYPEESGGRQGLRGSALMRRSMTIRGY